MGSTPVSDQTIVSLLRSLSRKKPEQQAFVFLGDLEGAEQSITYSELLAAAQAFSDVLTEKKLRGERALVLYPSGLEYLIVLFGCFMAGVVAVPLFTPRKNRTLDRVNGIVEDSQASVAIAPTKVQSKVSGWLTEDSPLRTLDWVSLEGIDPAMAPVNEPAHINGDTIAFLQYTSGSSGVPKGVMVSHQNLLSNAEMAARAFGHDENTIFAGWLPLYHDMGLIGNIIQPLFLGVTSIFMAPATFLRTPIRWLQAISKFKATTSGAPNFAFDLCVERIGDEEMKGLDLSSWAVAFNGAEPVRAATLEKFAAHFQPCGFRADAFYPCYGMAEATLFISGGHHLQAPIVTAFDPEHLSAGEAVPGSEDKQVKLVSNGTTYLGLELCIVDPESLQKLPDRAIGEVWVRGNSIAQGYWNNPEATEHVFRALPAGEQGHGYLRTGDLGFIYCGELYLTGRHKDLIIVRGNNHYPQDIEQTVEAAHPAMVANGCAVVARETPGQEQIIVGAEVSRTADGDLPEAEIFDAIRTAVAREHGISLGQIMLLRKGTLPKTTSGKVMRRPFLAASLNDEITFLAKSEDQKVDSRLPLPEELLNEIQQLPSPEQEAHVTALLLRMAGEILKVSGSDLRADRKLAELGLDSLQSMVLLHQVESFFQIRVTEAEFAGYSDLSDLSAAILEKLVSGAAEPLGEFELPSRYSLSDNQKIIYLTQQLVPESPVFNLHFSFRFPAQIDKNRLRAAIDSLLKRHPLLKIRVEEAGSEILQSVHVSAPSILQEYDLEFPDEGALKEKIEQQVRQPFDLTRQPPCRFVLFTIAGQPPVFLIVVHHLVADLWSLEILLRDLADLYAAPTQAAVGQTGNYALFVQKQQQWRNLHAAHEQKEYWLDRLGGDLPETGLLSDFPRPANRTFSGKTVLHQLEKSTADRLRELSAEQGVTLFSSLMSAWCLLLHKYTDQDEILIGYPVTERNDGRFSNTIGNFVNTLVHRSSTGDVGSYSGFLKNSAGQIQTSLHHRHYPFLDLVNQMAPNRTPSHPALIQVWFALHQLTKSGSLAGTLLPQSGKAFNFVGLPCSTIGIEDGAAQFDLSLFGEETENGIALSLNYNSDLFREETASRMLRHLDHLLNAICRNPQSSLAELSYLEPQERQQVVSDFNATANSWANAIPLHQLFEQQVKRTPDQTAVIFEENSLTYLELNQAANVLAAQLVKKGVGPNGFVAVCMDRSIEMVIALYAILKAGGAYVPIDPAYPTERKKMLLKDMDHPVVVIRDNLMNEMEEIGPEILSVSLNELKQAQSDTIAFPSTAGPADLAYMIYTSGSTGEPKGVMIEHRGISNRLLWMQSHFQLSPADRILQKTPYSFDVSVWEFFWTLLNGACLVVARPEGHRDPEYLRDLIVKESVTIVHFVPSMLEAFLDQPGLDQCKSLRNVICSGEALSSNLRDRFFSRLHCPLTNLYGPTEASVDVTCFECLPSHQDSVVPIGKPIANTEIFILDRHQKPVGIGVPGELYISGIQVARGYYNRSSLSAKHFVPNPLRPESREITYRSGDLAKWRPDGNIEFLGRLDFQVKINGFRIETGEIEYTLLQHPEVSGAVVAVKQGNLSQPVLVAYVVPAPGKSPEISDLISFLVGRLPSHFVPSAFVFLQEFPLNAAGKMNRKALPEYEAAQIPSAEYVAPKTKQEKILTEVWQIVLGLEKVGIRDNYFRLGGDSLRAIQVKAHAQAHGVRFSIHQLLQYQTIELLCLNLDDAASEVDKVPQVGPFDLISEEDRKKIPEGVVDAFPLSSLQAGLVFITESNRESAFYHDIFFYRMKEEFNFELMDQAIQLTARNHPILRTSLSINGYSQPLQLVHEKVKVSVSMCDFRDAPEGPEVAIAAWTEKEKENFFDWNEPPLVRFYLQRITDDTFNYVLSFHDSILDGWSGANMNTEVFEYYAVLMAGRQPQLRKPPKYSYREFVAMELRTSSRPESIAYWKQLLSDKPFTVIPRWHRMFAPSGPSQSHDHDIFFEEDLFEKILSFSKKYGFPLKSVLLATHLRVMQYLTRETDMISGLLANGRVEETDGDKVLGMHLNMVPFRAALTGGSWVDLVRQIFDLEHQMLPHRRYPLPRLQDQGNAPLFEFAFNFIHFHIYENFPHFEEMFQKGSFIDPLHYPLTANFRRFPFGNKLLLSLNYNDADLSQEQVNEIGKYYVNSCRAMVADPSAPYLESDLMPASERALLLEEWNNTDQTFPVAGISCLHIQIGRQMATHPSRPAVFLGDAQMTYAELEQATSKIARAILDHPDDSGFIGICMERSFEMVAGLLGILKAGKAYLPLDPTYPEDRIGYMIKDASATLVLVKDTTPKCLSSYQGLLLQAKSIMENPDNVAAPDPGSNEKDLAYLIYTSGSTGNPNGVMVSHKAICNRLYWMQDAYQLGLQDRVMQKTPFTFDVSVWEFFWPLMTGASIVLAEPEGHKDPMYLVQLIDEMKVTTLHFVPSMLKAFLAELPAGSCLSLKNVFCSGEALGPELKNKFFEHLNARLHNLYGPTEAAVDVSYWECRPDDGMPVVPIGKPISNIQLYVLGEGLELLPIGTPGELYIGGTGLAEGYLNRPVLNRERFIDNPYGGTGRERLYKTGDLARFLPTGDIEFLGRKDFQVKLRGFRIEPGEIEAQILSHPLIQDTVVIPRTDGPGEMRLVTYLIRETKELASVMEKVSGEFLSEWENVFDEAYVSGEGRAEGTVNLKGWNNSYTGDPIPPEEMKEFVDGAVLRVMETNPNAVLELGVGTGLILFQVAPQVQKYVGSDISASALAYIDEQLQNGQVDIPAERVQLFQQAAHITENIGRGGFDTVVLNSIIQYCPSDNYLREIIAAAIHALGTKGYIFLGDVRNHDLHYEFCASLVSYQADPDLTSENIRHKIRQLQMNENELLVSPQFFYALPKEFPELARIDIQLKRAKHQNELTRFRYDVTLHLGSRNESAHWLEMDWEDDRLSIGRIEELLADQPEMYLVLRNIPNARLSHLADLNDRTAAGSPGELRNLDSDTGIEPGELWAMEERYPYKVNIRPGVGERRFVFQAEFIHRNLNPEAIAPPEVSPDIANTPEKWVNSPSLRRAERDIVAELRAYLHNLLPQHMVPSSYVFLAEFPLSPNGKLDRKALPAPDAEQFIRVKKFVHPGTKTEEILAGIWQNVLGLEKVGIHDDFFELNGDSLLSIQITARARDAGLNFVPRHLFQFPTIAGLARFIEQESAGDLEPEPEFAGRIPLSPKQKWFFDLNLAVPGHWNSGVLIEFDQMLDAEITELAIRELLKSHQALRCTFFQEDEGWVQEIHGPEELNDLFSIESFDANEPEEVQYHHLYRGFHLDQLPLLRVAFVPADSGKTRLCLVFHHLVLEAVSCQILVEKITRYYAQLISGDQARMPQPRVSFRKYLENMAAAAHNQEVQRDISYWMQPGFRTAGSVSEAFQVPSEALEKSTRRTSLVLDKSLTQSLLDDVPQAYRTKIQDILLSALAKTIAARTGNPSVLIDVLTHGRDWTPGDVDLSQTVGWLTATLPVLFEVPKDDSPEHLIKQVKEAVRQMPHKGIGLEILRTYGDSEIQSQLESLPKPEVCFNYQGNIGHQTQDEQGFQLLYPPYAEERGADNRRPYLFEIEVHVYQEQMYFQWYYSTDQFGEDQMQALAEDYRKAISDLEKHCLSVKKGNATPSDFPLANLDQIQLDQILDNF